MLALEETEKQSIVDHIQSKLCSSERYERPWPHYVFDNFFPTDFYQRLKDDFPLGSGDWRPLSHPQNSEGKRQVIYLRRGEDIKIDDGKKQIWADLYDIFDRRVSESLLGVFDLDRYATKSWAEVQIIHDTTGYGISPHCDTFENRTHKILTLLVYFPVHDNMTEYGTELYSKNIFGRFKKEKQAPFSQNTALLFNPRWNQTWHGVSTIDRHDVTRTSLQIFFKV